MDLATIKPAESILEIVHPGNGEKLGIKVSLLSLDDDALKKIKRRIQDAGYQLQKKGKVYSAEEIENNTNLLLFTAMTGWVWEKPLLEPATDEKPAVYGEQPDFRGESPIFNQPNVYKIFNELPWFREQIMEKTGETKSFFQT